MKFLRNTIIGVTFLGLLVACQGQTKEGLVKDGKEALQQGNPLGAVVFFKNALDQDPNYIEARHQLGLAYLKANKPGQAEKELQKAHLQAPQNGDVLLDLSLAYLVLNQGGEAEKYVGLFLESHEKNSRSQEYLGLVAQFQGNLAIAESLFTEAIELDGHNEDAFLAQIRLLLMQERRKDAEVLLQSALKKFPQQEKFYFMLASLKARQGRMDETLNAYQQVIAIDPGNIIARYWAGMLSLDMGDIVGAQRYADALKQNFPKHPAGKRLNGMILYVQGDYKAAAVALRESLKGMADLAGYYFLGLTEFRLKHYELALNQFQQALDLQPNHVQARVMLGMTLLQQKRIDDCIYQVTQVLQEHDDLAVVHNVLGTAYLSKGDFDLATRHFDRAIALDPLLADPHLKKGLLNLSQQNSQKAEFELEKALEVAPESLKTRFLLASLYLKQENYQGVIDLLQESVGSSEQDALLYNYMAAAYLAQKQDEEGLAALKKAKAIKPNYLAPYFNLANYYLIHQQREEALEEYRAVLEVAPDNLRALISMASLEEVGGNNAAAEAGYERARKTNEPRGYMALAGYFQRSSAPQKSAQVVEDAYHAHPQNPTILKARGRLKLEQKDFPAAIETFKALEAVSPTAGMPFLAAAWIEAGEQNKAISMAEDEISQHPKGGAGYLLLAAVQQQLGQPEKAISALQQGISLADNPRFLLLQLGGLYLKTGQTKQAEDVFHKLRQQYPEFVPGTYAYGMFQDQRGNKQDAESLYREVLAKAENHTGAMNNLAYLYAENNSAPQEALTLAMRAFRNEPSNPVILDTLGLALIKNKRYDEAISILAKAVELLPKVAIVHLHYGQALSGAGQVDEAEKVLGYVAGLQVEPESRRAQQLLNQLQQ